jgi:hypothetical protein
MAYKHLGVLVFSLFILTACGQVASSDEEECTNCVEQELGEDPTPADSNSYIFPTWNSSRGIPQGLWDKTRTYYNAHWPTLRIRRYAAMVNLGAHSSTKRFWLLDLKTGQVTALHTAHGKGSDPDGDGYATKFSNLDSSHMSSLGIAITGPTYVGSHGRSLRLYGQEATNSNMLDRAIVVHAATYVSEARNVAGRSFGCPALDPAYAQDVIDKLKDGALLVIGNL